MTLLRFGLGAGMMVVVIALIVTTHNTDGILYDSIQHLVVAVIHLGFIWIPVVLLLDIGFHLAVIPFVQQAPEGRRLWNAVAKVALWDGLLLLFAWALALTLVTWS